jgi:hypothetical protein
MHLIFSQIFFLLFNNQQIEVLSVGFRETEAVQGFPVLDRRSLESSLSTFSALAYIRRQEILLEECAPQF